jgi:hypothetical protein
MTVADILEYLILLFAIGYILFTLYWLCIRRIEYLESRIRMLNYRMKLLSDMHRANRDIYDTFHNLAWVTNMAIFMSIYKLQLVAIPHNYWRVWIACIVLQAVVTAFAVLIVKKISSRGAAIAHEL